jgi:hypothetical protein
MRNANNNEELTGLLEDVLSFLQTAPFNFDCGCPGECTDLACQEARVKGRQWHQELENQIELILAQAKGMTVEEYREEEFALPWDEEQNND